MSNAHQISEQPNSSSDHHIIVEKDVMIPMRDGVLLAADIYRPSNIGSWPVILERTPYNKSEPSRSEYTSNDPEPWPRARMAGFFAKTGYVVIYQDCRGRYNSEGEFTKYLNEGEDGFDTVEWLAKQSWCDGRVVTKGLSYAAHTQSATACLAPKALSCMFLDSGGFSNAYRSGIRQGGAFELKQATWAYKHAHQSPLAKSNPSVLDALRAEDIREWFKKMPWTPGNSPLKAVPEYEDYLFDQWHHGIFDEFWKCLGIYAEGYYEQYADVPMVHMSSWYDPYALTAVDNYLALKDLKKGPVHLIIGPWTHGQRAKSFAGDVDFGPAATFDGNVDLDYPSFRLRWFDHWLKGKANGIENSAPVQIFVMGGGTGQQNSEGRLDHGGKWREAKVWPLPETQYSNYYLCTDGCLSNSPPSSTDLSVDLISDPLNPVPTIGGNMASGTPLMEPGACDQREGEHHFGSKQPYQPLAERDDVLVFQTDILSRPCEVTGPIIAKLFISSNSVDTDFTIKLIDVYPASADYPDGFAMNLTTGILRARYRNSFEEPEMMVPGEIYKITVEAFPTSNLFMPGHRIRLDIAGSNFPHFDVNPNSGEPEGFADHPRIATSSIYVGEDGLSHIILPIVPH